MLGAPSLYCTSLNKVLGYFRRTNYFPTTMPLPQVHLLTCPQRAVLCAETLARWARTDWPVAPRVHLDSAPEEGGEPWGSPERWHRLTDAFAGLLRAVLAEPGAEEDWLLLLEDDLDFHPRLAAHVGAWAALRDEHCRLASLFNSGVRPRAVPNLIPHAFAAAPDFYLGAQALLLRRGAAAEALRRWDALTGLQSQRLAKLLGREGPLWVHQPSLVQHVAPDSSWGARVKRALDFDPAWEAPKKGRKC